MQFGYRECGSNKEDRAYNVLRVATVTLSIPILPHINFPGYVAFELHQQQQLSTQPTTTFNTQRLPQTLTDGSFNMFQSNSSSGLDMKKCSRCKKTTFPNMFYRRGATWKTCNACSAASSAAHAANRQETLRANTSPTVWPGNDAYITAGYRILQLQGEHARAQQEFEHYQQQRYEQVPSTALGYLMSPVPFEPSPQEMYQQQRRMNGMDAVVDSNQGAGQGRIPASDDQISANLRAFLNEMEQQPLPFNFEEYAANELQAEYQAEPSIIQDSNLDAPQMDSVLESLTVDQLRDWLELDSSTPQDSTSQPFTAPADPAPVSLNPTHYHTPVQQFTTPAEPPLSLSGFFSSFSATQDLLRQPESPEQGLTGRALIAYLISEFGLASRLEALYHRWSGKDHSGNGHLHQFFQELYSMHQLEANNQATPWEPLSGWLVIYEQEFGAFAADYELYAEVSWQEKRKYQARKLKLSRQLKMELRDAYKEQMESTELELRKAFVELTGRSEHEVKKALQKELQNVARKVKGDCLNNGILFIDKDRYGKYKFVETK